MLKRFEMYIIDIIKGKRKGLLAHIVKFFLLILSWPYRLIIVIRNLAYDSGWLYQYDTPVPVVISVGNIVLGGSGKTPITLLLANHFYDAANLAIISRGWRSPAEKLKKPVTLSNGKGPLHSAAYCGDEPYLLAENFPKAFVFVGRDKKYAANLAAQKGADLIILDDAMQHRRLARDYEVVVMDGRDPFGKNLFFPRGFLREGPKSIKRADLVILNHVENEDNFNEVKEAVNRYTKAPVVGTKVEIQKIYDLNGNEITTIKDKRLAIFCGIAHPEQFLETVKGLGASVVGQKFFPDHHFFNNEEIVHMADSFKAEGAEMLICTEKDKVKLSDLPLLPIPIFWIKMELVVSYGRCEWDSFIGSIRKKFTATVGEKI